MKIKKKLRKPCKRCEKMFRPTGNFQTLCKNCNKNKKLLICPFLEKGKFCTNKHHKHKNNKNRTICIYKYHIKCQLFLDWQETLAQTNNNAPSIP